MLYNKILSPKRRDNIANTEVTKSNATDDDNVDFRSFKKNQHSKLES